MIDTVKLRSPELAEAVAAAIERQLITRRGIDGPTGLVLWELVSGPLVGSWDHRISLAVKRERWVSHRLPKRRDAAGRYRSPAVADLVPCAPYLEVEGSVHKAMLGHNLYGGSSDFRAVCRWFVAWLAEGLSVALPPADRWEARRIDTAEVYGLSYEACEAVIRGLAAADYPRRRLHRYGNEAVFFPGSTTAVKVYHKGPEFAAHDRARLRAVLGAEDLAALQWRANELLRVEVEIKARKLDADHCPPEVGRLSAEYVTGLHDLEVARMLREGAGAREIVRTTEAVRDRLYAVYSERQAAALFSTWVQFSALGEDQTKGKMRRTTFYRHRQELQAAGVSWHGSDVAIVSAGPIPAGFSPIRSDPRRLTGEAPRVVELLAPFRDQAAAAVA